LFSHNAQRHRQTDRPTEKQTTELRAVQSAIKTKVEREVISE